MTKQNMYYRVMLTRGGENDSSPKTETAAVLEKAAGKQTVKFAEPKLEEEGGAATKVCSGHLGKQLAAVRKDGRPYACGFGKDCTFSHVSIVGKSNQKLLEIAAGMPSPMKQDLTKAIGSKK